MSVTKEEFKDSMRRFGCFLGVKLEEQKKLYFRSCDIAKGPFFSSTTNKILCTIEDCAIQVFYDEGDKSYQGYLEPILFRGTIKGICKDFESVNEYNGILEYKKPNEVNVGDKNMDYTGKSLIYLVVKEVFTKGLLIKKIDNISYQMRRTEMLDDLLEGMQMTVGNDHTVYFGIVCHPERLPFEYGEDYLINSNADYDKKIHGCRSSEFLGSGVAMGVNETYANYFDPYYFVSLDEKPKNGLSATPFSYIYDSDNE